MSAPRLPLPLPPGPWGPVRLVIAAALLIALCFSGGGVVLTTIVAPLLIDPLGLSASHATALTVIIEKSLSLLVALLAGLILLRPLSARLLGTSWPDWRQWIRPVAFGVLGILALNGFVKLWDLLFARESGGGSLLSSAGIGSGPWADVAVVLAIGAIGPVFEEFLYRGFLHRSVRDLTLRLGGRTPLSGRPLSILAVAVGCVVSSMMFVDLHGVLFGDSMYAIFFVYGAIAVLVYELTGSLYAAVIFHAGQNSWAIAQGVTGPDVAISVVGWCAIVAAPVVAVVLTWACSRLLDVTGGDRSERLDEPETVSA